MNTEQLDMTEPGSRPFLESLARAADLLRGGEAVAFPTETVYGLGADATNDEAVARIYEAKGRPASNPTIVHVATADEASRLTTDWNERAQRLAARFWPGPLTMVLPASRRVSRVATAGGETVGVRCPRHSVALAIISAAGVPVAAPSANRSGCLSPVEADAVLADLGGRISAVVDGGRCRVGIESTVIDLTGPGIVLLRPGAISRTQLAEATGEPVTDPVTDQVVLRSPGMLARHYAPRIPLQVHSRFEMCRGPFDDGIFRIFTGFMPVRGAPLMMHLPPHPDAYGAQLYATLRFAEESGARAIWIELPPESPEWEAIHDRLHRAAEN